MLNPGSKKKVMCDEETETHALLLSVVSLYVAINALDGKKSFIAFKSRDF